MTDESEIMKAGRLLMIDTGSYSDHMVLGFFVVLSDFNPIEEIKAIKASGHTGGMYKVVAALIAKGLLLEIEPSNLYLDECHLEESSFTP